MQLGRCEKTGRVQNCPATSVWEPSSEGVYSFQRSFYCGYFVTSWLFWGSSQHRSSSWSCISYYISIMVVVCKCLELLESSQFSPELPLEMLRNGFGNALRWLWKYCMMGSKLPLEMLDDGCSGLAVQRPRGRGGGLHSQTRFLTILQAEAFILKEDFHVTI